LRLSEVMTIVIAFHASGARTFKDFYTHLAPAHSHKVFKQQVDWGNSTGWKFGFKLHLIINEQGERLAFKLTPAHIDDRTPVPEMSEGIFGKLIDKILLRKRSNIESVNDQLKNICQIEHSRQCSCWNFHLMAGLIAYTYQPKFPSLDLQPKGLLALPPAIF
jgi:hypothetical protein